YASATDVATRFRNTTAMQVETLPKGIYLIEVVINGKKTVGKIVIE
ncbi:MAG: T9SS C-terminal target domain-containing protein, partial [Chitinophagia bacterium]|nr:T9SS C-terminal target domain-containing protein [Chitinophagia bacterium]